MTTDHIKPNTAAVVDRLVQEATHDPIFTRSPNLVALLQLLAQHSKHGSGALSVKKLSFELDKAAGNKSNSDSKATDRVRVMMMRLRHALRIISEREGSKFQYRLEIPHDRGGYRLECVPALNAISSFWSSYANKSPTDIVLARLLSFRRDRVKADIRHAAINRWVDIIPKAGNLPEGDELCKPSNNYLSAGEVEAALSLLGTFQAMNLSATISLKSEFHSSDSLRDHNLVVLGDTRANPLIGMLEYNKRLQSTPFGVRSVSGDNKEPEFADYLSEDCAVHHVLLTRCPTNGMKDGVATAISSSSGLAISVVTSALEGKQTPRSLRDAISGSTPAVNPSFQAVFRVELYRGMVGGFEVVSAITAGEI